MRVMDYADLQSDVLDRLDGLEDLNNNSDMVSHRTTLFSVETINRILEDEEDDTNETTKNRIKDLVDKLKKDKVNWLMVVEY